MDDPVEAIVALALDHAGIAYSRDNALHLDFYLNALHLDFYLPDWDIYIECKAYHTERSLEQLARHPGVILIQGMTAALAFKDMLIGSHRAGSGQ